MSFSPLGSAGPAHHDLSKIINCPTRCPLVPPFRTCGFVYIPLKCSLTWSSSIGDKFFLLQTFLIILRAWDFGLLVLPIKTEVKKVLSMQIYVTKFSAPLAVTLHFF